MENILKKKMDFIHNYIHSSGSNNASLSTVDANANVNTKNVATMFSELHKDINAELKKQIIFERMEKLFSKEDAEQFIHLVENHHLFIHDSASAFLPYCVSIDATPFIENGLTFLGGESKAPKHLNSFCGSYINLIFAIASQFAGAVADVGFLKNFHYYAKKDYGDNYLETHTKTIKDHFEWVIYSLNQPAASRGFQSVFYNISIFDEYYFNSIFGSSVYPDFSNPDYAEIDKLQRFFMDWIYNERKRALLTFPVITAAMLTEGDKMKDGNFLDFAAEQWEKGNTFFIYSSNSPDTLSSCCRLRNEISNDFSFSLGAGGVATGSKLVVTMNMNRIVQDNVPIEFVIDKTHKAQVAFNEMLYDMYNHDLLPVYKAGFISLDKQYLTVGINGMVEAAEYLGYTADYNQPYVGFLQENLKKIFDINKRDAKIYSDLTGHKVLFNTEFVPAESLGVKNAKWDRADGYVVPRDCYNSYFYKVEDEQISFADKLRLHGEEVLQYLDGGSAAHINLSQHMTKEAFKKFINLAAKFGSNYITYNVLKTHCECGHIDVRTLKHCPVCGSDHLDYSTRVIGYEKKVSSWQKERQEEHDKRHYHLSA